jgi:hypothetical protein
MLVELMRPELPKLPDRLKLEEFERVYPDGLERV